MRGESDETGSWKIICTRGPEGAQRLALAARVRSTRSLAVVEDDLAGIGRDGAHDDLADRGLAAAALADEAEAFAAPDVEADIVDGLDDSRLRALAEEFARAGGVGLAQMPAR